jgi:hypothetical protein
MQRRPSWGVSEAAPPEDFRFASTTAMRGIAIEVACSTPYRRDNDLQRFRVLCRPRLCELDQPPRVTSARCAEQKATTGSI